MDADLKIITLSVTSWAVLKGHRVAVYDLLSTLSPSSFPLFGGTPLNPLFIFLNEVKSCYSHTIKKKKACSLNEFLS